jgi:hypothetical protein
METENTNLPYTQLISIPMEHDLLQLGAVRKLHQSLQALRCINFAIQQTKESKYGAWSVLKAHERKVNNFFVLRKYISTRSTVFDGVTMER